MKVVKCEYETVFLWAGNQRKQKESAMGSEDCVYIFMCSYASEADAEVDYDAMKELFSIG